MSISTNTTAQPTSEGPNPARVFETLNAYQRSAALKGAIELDLFTAIGRGSDSVADLAGKLQADPRGLRILCDYLVVDGFLAKQGDQYSLTETAALFLDRGSPVFMGETARFMNSPRMLAAFENVAELVRRGRTLLGEQGTTETEYEGWVEFARSMVALMRPQAEFIGEMSVQRKPGPIRVLDIAAGHGMFGITVAQRNPRAAIVALDWANVLKVARENATAAGVSDRISLLPGDALRIEFGTGYDLVLVTNFFHHFNEATCIGVMRKVVSGLNENGLVMTLEFVPNDDRVSPPQPATFAFTMLGTTPEGDAYTFADYQRMWQSAGLSSHEMFDVPRSTQRLIISSR